MVSLPTINALDAIAIPITCPVPWDSMRGDHRTRFCSQCKQNVHDVSELTRAEAVQLVTAGDQLPCLRLYRRQDGRVMTADCTTNRERAWKWLYRHSPWLAALFALVFFAGCDPFCTTGVPVGPASPPPDEATLSVVGGAAVVAAKHEASGKR
jgi:hypothetical protein